MRRVLVVFAWFIAVATHSLNAQIPNKSIFYSGQLDGFSGSAASCLTLDCLQRVANVVGDLRATTPGSILVGLGDNFAPDTGASFKAQMDVHQRLDPQFSADHFRVIDFLRDTNYDAVVPGVQDFYFGAAFVRRSEEEVNMVATNLVRTAIQPSTCPAFPQLPPVTILLPNQISSAIASGSSASGAGTAGSGSGGGGGKGKGGKKGGGGASASSAGGAAGGGGGGAAPATCLPQPDAEVHKGSDTTHPPPKILWPDANSIYPWTTEIGFAKPLTNVYLCTPEDPNGPPKTLDLTTCTENLVANGPLVGGSGVHYPIAQGHLGITKEGLILPYTVQTSFKLLAGAAGRICYIFDAPPDQVNHSCATITVQEPMFEHAWRAPEGKQYVILGALAPDTLNGLSRIDTAWYEDKHARKVARQVAVNDPTSAVLQALHAFDLLNPDRTGDYGVLLAQMPPSEAKALADSLGESSSRGGNKAVAMRVNLIFSAADLVESSPNLTVNIEDPAQTEANSNDTYYIPVFTPAPVFQKTDCLAQDKDPRECFSYVSPILGPGAGGVTTVQLKNVPSVNARQSPASPVEAWSTPYCADVKAPSEVQVWECAVLKRMLEDTSANPKLGNSSDIAILQGKDFDFSRNAWARNAKGPPTPDDAAAILWRSGRLARVSLLGSTIETLLMQNDKLQGQNFQVLPSSRSMQQLKILGITKVGEVYYINGMPLSETQTYSVATTDRLANTTSDFPQLAQMDLDNPNLFPLGGKTVEIEDIALVSRAGPHAQYVALYAADDLEGPEPTPATKKKGPEPKAPSYSYSNRTVPDSVVADAEKLQADAVAADKQLGTGEKAPQPLPTTEEMGRQLRPFLRVTLQQTALSYSSATPNQSDPSIGTNFGGVSNPNVSAAYSLSASALQNARLVWYPAHGRKAAFEDMGLDNLLNFAENVQGSLAPPPAIPVVTTAGVQVPERVKSLTANNITLSPFFEFQVPRLPVWKALVVRAIGSDNVAQPLPQYLAGCTAGSNLTFVNNGSTLTPTCDANATKDQFQFSLRRTWTFGESIGTRLEKNDFSYAEVGFTHQRSHDVLSSVGVVNAGAANNVTYFCSLIGAQSLTFCASNMPAATGVSLVPRYSNYSQKGGYALVLWTTPLMKRVVLQGSGFGTFFAYGNKDQSVLTHYAFNSMVTALVNFPANFSVGPTLNEFFFQANSTRTIGSSLIRRTIGAQLNYSFDWHTGVSLKAFSGNSQ